MIAMKKSMLIVACLALLAVLVAWRAAATPQEGGAWEYQEVGLDGTAAALDQHGANGWELVTVYLREESPNPRYVFKRPAR
jgi:hypothetical protein